MIRTFRNRELSRLWSGKRTKIAAPFHLRLNIRLDVIDQAESVEDLNLPGYRLHRLKGKPVRYAIDVNGPWRLTFEFSDGDAHNVDFEQYH